MTNQPPQLMACDKPVDEFLYILIWFLILLGVAVAPVVFLTTLLVLLWA